MTGDGLPSPNLRKQGMKQRIHRNKTGAIILGALFLCATAAGQQSDWKKKTTNDGEVSMRYRFTEHVDQ